MKLLKRYRLFTYSSLCVVVLVGFVVNYYLFRSSIHRTTDGVLDEYRIDIQEYAEKHETLKPLVAINSKFGEILPVSHDTDLSELDEEIVDTLVYSHYQEEKVVYRKLVFPIYTKDQNYVVTLMLPALEEDDLVEAVLISLFLLVVLFILLTSLIDLFFTRQIFRPFHKIVARIKSYNVENRSIIQLPNSNIDEFQDLSRILTIMINQINEGYYAMKEFLEYTSHEIQTPLAVIQLKLDVLNQKGFQDPEVLNSINSIQNSLKRVVRFNRSVLFMAKIKNNQFLHTKKLALGRYIQDYHQQYDELLAMRNITYSFENKGEFYINIHPILAENLIQNLFTNAIQHNYDGGSIQVVMSPHELSIINTFNEPIPNGDLFSKYTHNKEKNGSNGIGLSIVKTICEKNKINLSYHIQPNEFSITIAKSV